MERNIILLSGAISSGKSTLGKQLATRYEFQIFRTRDVLLAKSKIPDPDRIELQKIGDQLDTTSNGQWVADAIAKHFGERSQSFGLIIDSVRIKPQIEKIRAIYGQRVIHIHLTASKGERYTRYLERLKDKKESADMFELASQNPTEENIELLNETADIVVDTIRCNSKDVFTRVISRLEGYHGRGRGFVDVIIGAQYGSEGKGQIAGFLAKEYDLLVRVGGPNAGHTVYVPHLKGESYTHHQIPSGTLKSDAKLVIGPGAVINPELLLKEINECKVKPTRLIIDGNAMTITDEDILAEKKLKRTIGSTGQGVGAATSRRIMQRNPETQLAKNDSRLKEYIGDAIEELASTFQKDGRVLLEGTQGTGLSLYHGLYPFVTSRDTSVGGCLAEAGIAPSRLRRTIMVCRTYEIRVEDPKDGTSGPMKCEIDWETIGMRSGLDPEELRQDEHTSTTNRLRRVGEFDWELLRKSCLLNSPTDIAVTFTDYINSVNRNACRFEQLTESTLSFIQEIEKFTGASVSIITTGFNDRSVIDRRSW